MEKALFITPHLSTGGAPQYLLRKIKELKKIYDITCVEYDDITGGVLVVQKEQIKKLLGEKLITLNENKFLLLDIINDLKPDIVHLEEVPEYFMLDDVAKRLYSEDREYKIIETSHDSSFDTSEKKFFPDGFIFVSEYQRRLFSTLDIPSFVVEYPIDKKQKTDREKALLDLGLDPSKKHFLNVGLFTPRKNQMEMIEYARKMIDYDCQFHFVGNQAENFEFYWRPLMANFPLNCKWWGERSDVDTFYNAMDYFLFTSKGFDSDKETNPIVLKEAVGWDIPIIMYNLPVYLNSYDKYNVTYLSDDFNANLNLLKGLCQTHKKSDKERDLKFNIYLDKNDERLIRINYLESEPLDCIISVLDADTYMPIYFFEAAFSPYSEIYVIPIGNRAFTQEEHFSTFLIQFFTPQKEFICEKRLFVKERQSKPETLNFHYPPFDCTYVNYREMFYENVYGFCNIDNLETVVDIGANVGIFSLYMLIKRGCQLVHAVEPTDMAYEKLKIAAKNYDGIITHKVAVYNHDGTLTISCKRDNSAISKITSEEVDNSDRVKFPCVTLSTFLTVNNLDSVDLIKVDIEGAEFAVFDAASDKTILRSKRYIIEYHVEDGERQKLHNLVNRLEGLGYKLKNKLDPTYSLDNSFFYAEKC